MQALTKETKHQLKYLRDAGKTLNEVLEKADRGITKPEVEEVKRFWNSLKADRSLDSAEDWARGAAAPPVEGGRFNNLVSTSENSRGVLGAFFGFGEEDAPRRIPVSKAQTSAKARLGNLIGPGETANAMSLPRSKTSKVARAGKEALSKGVKAAVDYAFGPEICRKYNKSGGKSDPVFPGGAVNCCEELCGEDGKKCSLRDRLECTQHMAKEWKKWGE